ncbi:hypothetical protein DFH09DRAFT_1076936 [Mycena vulgaris]|nr:hypothetical protein DFH09DRAFT_1076936 [Mycena vulgaris]
MAMHGLTAQRHIAVPSHRLSGPRLKGHRAGEAGTGGSQSKSLQNGFRMLVLFGKVQYQMEILLRDLCPYGDLITPTITSPQHNPTLPAPIIPAAAPQPVATTYSGRKRVLRSLDSSYCICDESAEVNDPKDPHTMQSGRMRDEMVLLEVVITTRLLARVV